MYGVVEFYGTGDPYFGGDAEDRSLGWDGEFLVGGHHVSERALFETEQDAQLTAEAARNKRKGGLISVLEIPA